jgi:hypothetical protein
MKIHGFTRLSITNKTIDWLNKYTCIYFGRLRQECYITTDQTNVTPDGAVIYRNIIIESVNCFLCDTQPCEIIDFYHHNLSPQATKRLLVWIWVLIAKVGVSCVTGWALILDGPLAQSPYYCPTTVDSILSQGETELVSHLTNTIPGYLPQST